MIIVEAIKNACWSIARFFYWVITARDCAHCKWGDDNLLYFTCWRTNEKHKACMKSIRRVAFERKKDGDGNGNG